MTRDVGPPQASLETLLELLLERTRAYAQGGEAPDARSLVAELGREPLAAAASLGRPFELGARLAAELGRALERRQQFRALEPDLLAALAASFERSLTLLARLLAEPDGDLLAACSAVLAGEAREVGALLGRPLQGPAVVCAEYSVQLQVELLGVDVQALLEPILDLGCGEAAAFVSHCRAQGKVVLGLDRHARAPHTLCADWLEHSFAPASFGTIVSHQAFSLHFLHHHLSGHGHAEDYAHKYMQLLDALVPGGSFVYAPGLPFVERFLPAERFGVVRRALPGALRRAVGELPNPKVLDDVAYACQVTKRSS